MANIDPDKGQECQNIPEEWLPITPLRGLGSLGSEPIPFRNDSEKIGLHEDQLLDTQYPDRAAWA